ncbi:hypothetical protein PanWU01x14_264420 [Parasponia andersonii]|uniref:Factor of DNA methylation 1-5/IDN2 domain-containing protein n=1 Tax=Parasponia andersonii TaxID=3476 RepID=A0A2P5B7H8_PARAD|nr:hypothetical protein PanWU01x14_264420 [Parasponia andersonii]
MFRGKAAEVKKLEVLSQALITKERESNDELLEARMILINEVIDHGDKKLIGLKETFGFEVHNKVTTALTEVNDQGNQGVVPVLWNFNKGRKATLKDALECLVKQCNKRKA